MGDDDDDGVREKSIGQGGGNKFVRYDGSGNDGFCFLLFDDDDDDDDDTATFTDIFVHDNGTSTK